LVEISTAIAHHSIINLVPRLSEVNFGIGMIYYHVYKFLMVTFAHMFLQMEGPRQLSVMYIFGQK